MKEVDLNKDRRPVGILVKNLENRTSATPI